MTSGTDTHSVTVGFGDGLSSNNPGEIQQFSGPSAQVALQTATEGFVWFGLNGQGQPVEQPPVTPPSGVPEPASLALIGIGIAALGAKRRKVAA